MPTFPADYLRSFCESVLESVGAPSTDRKFVASSLVDANLRGHDSHGIVLLERYVEGVRKGQIRPRAEIRVSKDYESLALVDGGWNFGQVVAKHVMEIAIGKARSTGSGLGFVGAFRCNHIGRLGPYSMMAAREGLVALVLANVTDPLVAPHGGTSRRRLGTNPIAIAIPRRNREPLVLDMATSVVAGSKVFLKEDTGEPIPVGWIVDREGRPSQRAKDLREGGALLPLGGYKGFGLGLVVDILAGALTGSGGCDAESGFVSNGLLALAFRPDVFVSLEDFSESLEEIIGFVKKKGSDGESDYDGVRLPGEQEEEMAREARIKGVFIHDVTWSRLTKVARELKVTV